MRIDSTHLAGDLPMVYNKIRIRAPVGSSETIGARGFPR
jgi:hypothetical protein